MWQLPLCHCHSHHRSYILLRSFYSGIPGRHPKPKQGQNPELDVPRLSSSWQCCSAWRRICWLLSSLCRCCVLGSLCETTVQLLGLLQEVGLEQRSTLVRKCPKNQDSELETGRGEAAINSKLQDWLPKWLQTWMQNFINVRVCLEIGGFDLWTLEWKWMVSKWSLRFLSSEYQALESNTLKRANF